MVFTQFAKQEILNSMVNQSTNNSDLEWSNLCVKTSVDRFYKKVPETSLSIITNTSGIAHCKVDGKAFKVCDATFLIINPFQELEYEIDETGVKTCNVHFQFDFARSAFESIQEHIDLWYDERTIIPPIYNELHFKNKQTKFLLDKLGHHSGIHFEDTIQELMNHVMNLHYDTRRKVDFLNCIKKTTKEELFKRLCAAKDIIYSEYNSDLSLDDISKRIFLSKYHLIRSFKTYYGISPYQMIKYIRLQKAMDYLRNSSYTIAEIAEKVGFKEGNSLSNVFKNEFNCTPGNFRISNFQ